MKNIINKKRNFQLTALIVVAFAFAFMIYQASGIDAQISTPSVCCEKTTEGGFCMNTEESNCDVNYKISPTSCESTSYCRQGTCYDSSEGICMENTPQRVCDENNGAWDVKPIAELPQCRLGCCIIVDQAAFVPLVRCKKLSSLFGVEIDYRQDINSEIACIATSQSQDKGACVFEQEFQRTCKFTTRKDCNDMQIPEKKFYKDFLCSAEELNTACARQASTNCYQGKVYWLDSCGNRENVYSSDKDKSWNNGKVAKAWEICDANDGNDKDCGNCDYLLGSRCAKAGFLGGPTYGNYYCKKTVCEDRDGNPRKNGESWCVYDANHGDGKDPIGSRHFKEICIDGQVRVEPCADFRNEICIQGSIAIAGGEFTTANCRVNRWQDCVLQETEEDCENNARRDCMWLTVQQGSFCVPDIPPGFNFWEESDATEICSQASATCTVKYEKKILDIEGGTIKEGEWTCEENCECKEEHWLMDANKLCISLGDCGGYVNYQKEFTDYGYVWNVEGTEEKFSRNNINEIGTSSGATGSVIGLDLIKSLLGND